VANCQNNGQIKKIIIGRSLNILTPLSRYTSQLLGIILRGVCFVACLTLSWSVQADQNIVQKKQSIQLNYIKQSSSQRRQANSDAAKANQTTTNTKPSKMKHGLIKINRIQLQGDALYPEYGITNKFLHTRVNQVYSHMNELLSISDINKIADALTLAYREKGLTFNQAYVIPQEIVDSTLTIHVLKGTLSDVDIYSNNIYSTEQLTEPFAELLGQVIYEADITKIVSSLNKKPGLKIFSFFSVGSNQGEARLNVRVLDETRHVSQLIIDNKGVSQTGINRLMYSHTMNNPLNLSGQLRATILTTNKPDNFFGSLGYSRPLNPTNQLELSILRSDFAVTGQFSDLGLAGDLSSLTASWTNTPEHEKNAQLIHNRRLSLSTKQSTVTSEVFPEFLNEEVDYTTLSTSYQWNFLRPWQTNSQHILTFQPSISSITSTNNNALPSKFWLTKISYDFMTPLWISSIPSEHPFSMSATGQYTSKNLPSSEQFTTTGSNTNRGFEPGIFSGNNAYAISLEQAVGWAVDFNKHQNAISLQPFLFFDYSYGEQKQNTDISAKFQSAGLGLKVAYENLVKANISVGRPLDHKISGQPNIDRKRPVIYANLSLSF